METPTINVNRTPCDCWKNREPGTHQPKCAAKPVLIPLPLEPWRSVTFEVRLGECDYPRDACRFGHLNDCPASPIRVTCSIRGKTWAETRVSDAERADGPGQPNFTEAEHMRAVALCDDRWALVKALVLGTWRSVNLNAWQAGAMTAEAWARVAALVAQRDTVFAALADLARAEQAASDAQDRAHAAIGDDLRLKPHHNIEAADRPSAYMLDRYVARLIEQVGTL